MRKFGCSDVQYVELAALQQQAVPAWMLDEERCGQMTCGFLPTVDLDTLLELADWLQGAGLVVLLGPLATSGARISRLRRRP